MKTQPDSPLSYKSEVAPLKSVVASVWNRCKWDQNLARYHYENRNTSSKDDRTMKKSRSCSGIELCSLDPCLWSLSCSLLRDTVYSSVNNCSYFYTVGPTLMFPNPPLSIVNLDLQLLDPSLSAMLKRPYCTTQTWVYGLTCVHIAKQLGSDPSHSGTRALTPP